jgi:transcriptional regulator with GAF, ATPase, and Fis domain
LGVASPNHNEIFARREYRGLSSQPPDTRDKPLRRSVVVIPLLDPENLPGYARIVFAANPSVDVLSGPVLETLGSILSFAQSHCRVIERIAKLSSTAHHESQHLREELRKYSEADRIVARSESMRRVLESVDLVAGHDTAVLLRGESGTGKELLARRIHRLSKRARQQFVSVNCGALPETLIESELFGHERVPLPEQSDVIEGDSSAPTTERSFSMKSQNCLCQHR